jgi:hypothetical protein
MALAVQPVNYRLLTLGLHLTLEHFAISTGSFVLVDRHARLSRITRTTAAPIMLAALVLTDSHRPFR